MIDRVRAAEIRGAVSELTFALRGGARLRQAVVH